MKCTVTSLILLWVIKLCQPQDQPGYCPCNFNFSQKEDDKDPSCYGSVPLIAGIKDIDADSSLTHRAQSFSMNKVVQYTCKHYDAFVVTLKIETGGGGNDEVKDFIQNKLDSQNRPELYNSLYFYTTVRGRTFRILQEAHAVVSVLDRCHSGPRRNVSMRIFPNDR